MSRHSLVLVLVLEVALEVAAAPPLAARERPLPPRDRIVWQRDDLMPVRQEETVRLRVLTTAQDGVTRFTRLYQIGDIWQRRLETLVYEVAGEELTGASALDMNDDGIKEVLLRFAPPRDQRRVRLVAFCYSRRDRRYVKILELGPEVGLRARWVSLLRTRELKLNGIAVERVPRGQEQPASSTVYRFEGEELHVASHTGAGSPPAPLPSSP